ncbi:hypothetical protein RJ640_020457 [Escallonia rubra]|uniref:Pentatricopeptide repeat-containing protein n=1 Tax=Escallonia rubra TaxID=112253 RepID=A0AA88U9V3_9ASTE|nr:hypothetical protein RJ640_020457 [Escallonia rubra]
MIWRLSNIPCKKLLRFPNLLLSYLSSLSSCPKTLNPLFRLHPDPFPSYGSLSFCPLARPFLQSPVSPSAFRFSTNCNEYPFYGTGLPRPSYLFRWFSVQSSSDNTVDFDDRNDGLGELGVECFDESGCGEKKIGSVVDSRLTSKQISEIIEVVRSDDSNLNSKLDLVGLNLSVRSINEVFRLLNSERIRAFRFFEWVRGAYPKLYFNCDVCSMMIDNCGRVDEYALMKLLLKEFTAKHVCLSEKAFGFLPVLGSSKGSLMDSIRVMIQELNEAGGSCRKSGIRSLIKMLCTVESFEMAKFVMEITERNLSYYNVFIRERCRICHFQEVYALLEEMRGACCEPDAKTYNSILGSLLESGKTAEACSLLEDMLQNGTAPDTGTFEIFIFHLCRVGRSDEARQFLRRMVSSGLEPGHTTHTAFVRGLFIAGQYEEAHKYVRDSNVKCIRSRKTAYSLLAELHLKGGNLCVASSILVEMMDKGLKPDYTVFKRVKRRLCGTGRGHLFPVNTEFLAASQIKQTP